MKKTQIFITKSFEETQTIGQKLGKKLMGGVIALYGDLGGGKTTFTQGLAKGVGITRRIISPTFVIVRSYKVSRPYSSSEALLSREDSSRQVQDVVDPGRAPRGTRTIDFYHIDLYRTENEQDIEGLGIKEIIGDPRNIVVIEWAEKLGSMLPKERIDVHFNYLSENERRISINKLT